MQLGESGGDYRIEPRAGRYGRGSGVRLVGFPDEGNEDGCGAGGFVAYCKGKVEWRVRLSAVGMVECSLGRHEQ